MDINSNLNVTFSPFGPYTRNFIDLLTIIFKAKFFKILNIFFFFLTQRELLKNLVKMLKVSQLHSD